ncbi:MAG: phytase, partial [bacterium]
MKSCVLKHFLTSMLLIAPHVFAQEQSPLQELPPVVEVNPKMSTSSVIGDADDPAIWVHPADPSKSLIVGTDK